MQAVYAHCNAIIAHRRFFWCAMLFVSLVVLSGCGQNGSETGGSGTATTTIASVTTGPSGKPILLQKIHMFNASAGWAVTYNPSNASRILRTTTGVTHWQDVTPAISKQNAIIGGTDFFDALTAWVAVAINQDVFVYRTVDGGKSWQKTKLPDQSVAPGQLFFLNARLGWMLAGKGAAMGSEAVDVLQTGDGGASWKIVAVSNNGTVNNPTAIPFGGDKSGLSFVNATTGWIVGSTPADNFVWLYVTHDAGATWRHQTLPLPPQAFQISAFPPVFFNATDGVLPVIIPGPKRQNTVIYITHDAGASWQATTSVPASAFADTIDFIDIMHGWIADNTFDASSNQYTNSTLYSTGDGGSHWTSHQVKLGTGIIMLDFVSPTQGWAIDSSQMLYQTTDGGQNWMKVLS